MWCHNPETISFGKQLSYNSDKCIGCKLCLQCPQKAIEPDGTSLSYNDAACVKCYRCAEDCPGAAIVVDGKEFEPEELLSMLLADESFYKKEGGVTLSGGEPTAQADFCEDLLDVLRRRHIHSALDTTGHCDRNTFSALCDRTDLVLFDIKHMDPQCHQQLCGVDNKLILENLTMLLGTTKPVEIRMPLIRGINDDVKDIEDAAGFLAGAKNVKQVTLLSYNPLGSSKPVGFKRGWGIKAERLSAEEMDAIVSIFHNRLPEVRTCIRN